MTVHVRRGTVRDPNDPRRFATVDDLGDFELRADDPRLVGATWSPAGWTQIEMPRNEILARLDQERARLDAHLEREQVISDRQLQMMEQQAGEE